MADPERAFLGTGWRFPPSFSRRACSAKMVSGEADVKESLCIILSTAMGERVMLPEFGCGIWRYVFRSTTTSLIGQVERAVAKAILNWEPRVTVHGVSASPRPGAVGILEIEIDFSIRGTNSRSNLVFPFYIEEGTIPPAIP